MPNLYLQEDGPGCFWRWRPVIYANNPRRVLRQVFTECGCVRIDIDRIRWCPIDSTIVLRTLCRLGDRPAALPAEPIEMFIASNPDDVESKSEERQVVGSHIRIMSGWFQVWVGKAVNLPEFNRGRVSLGMMLRHTGVALLNQKLVEFGLGTEGQRI